jgi:hypothetical protein
VTDRLASARRLSITALVVAALASGAPIADSLLRADSPGSPAPSLVEALRLSGPALHPAGTPDRQPETLAPGADLHISPGLVAFPLDDSGLLLPASAAPNPPRERER